MVFPSGLGYSQWNPVYNQETRGPSNGAALDPSVPRFTPTGMDVARYQAPQPQTLPQASQLEMAKIQQFVTDMSISSSSHFLAMDRRNRELADEVRRLENTMRTDIRTLESIITAVKKDEAVPHKGDNEAIGTRTLLPTPGNVKPPPSPAISSAGQHNDKNMKKDQVKLESSEYHVGVPNQSISPDESVSNKGEFKLTHAQHPGYLKSVKFACCEEQFDDLEALLHHVEEEHVNDKKPCNGDIALGGRDVDNTTKQDLTVIKHVEDNNSEWRPLGLRELKASTVTISTRFDQTFSFSFLRDTLKGVEFHPSFYKGSPMLPSDSYWLLEASTEPFLPTKPGEHGAKMTAFFNETPSEDAPEDENYKNVPVFIRVKGARQYTYFGMYSQPRFSDKMDYDTLTEHVPDDVIKYWGNQLGDRGRPTWVSDALRKHYWPKPKYDGPIPKATATPSKAASGGPSNAPAAAPQLEPKVIQALKDYAEELKDWDKDSKAEVSRITPDFIKKSFRRADGDSNPGLRLWWEYLEFQKYDEGFYNMLVEMRNSPRGGRVSGQAAAQGAGNRDNLSAARAFQDGATKAKTKAGGNKW